MGGNIRLKHPRLYRIWGNTRAACYSPTSEKFGTYGAKGIIICEEWDSFEVFCEWALTNGYTDDLCLSRKDKKGDYTPDNCHFLSIEEARRNGNAVATTIKVVIDGKERLVHELAEESGLHPSTIRTRIKNGVTGKALLAPPIRGRQRRVAK